VSPPRIKWRSYFSAGLSLNLKPRLLQDQLAKGSHRAPHGGDQILTDPDSGPFLVKPFEQAY
jgi:hypothetical protein